MGITTPKTKIICIIGPASEAPEVIRELIASGMRVARLNFSHGTHSAHEKKIHTIRKIAEELGKPTGQDEALGKATFVGQLGLDGARAKAIEMVNCACARLDLFAEKADLLRETAKFVLERRS